MLLAMMTAGSVGAQQNALTRTAPAEGAKLVWSDEFNAPDGTAPDAKKWTAIDDGTGFGNRELQYYTPRLKNAHLANGNLVITALEEPYTGKDGGEHKYTSARLESRGKYEVKFGRIESRIKIPAGQGIWPAFWMLGADHYTNGWPECGEIDIMENVGYEPGSVHGTLHGPGYSGPTPLGSEFKLEGSQRFTDDYHVYAIEWQPGEIRFLVDNKLFATRTAAALKPGQRWVFDHPFYILFDLAVGGNWPGNPDQTTKFPAVMLVDYVRVYQLAPKGN